MSGPLTKSSSLPPIAPVGQILSPLIVMLMILSAAAPAPADDAYVSFAKALPARNFDKSLPSVTTEQWLNSSLPPGIVAVWGSNVTDCGEQTGAPEIDKKRDMPLCAEIELKEKDRSAGYLLLFVGTQNKGKTKESAGLYYGHLILGGKTINLKSLHEITKLK